MQRRVTNFAWRLRCPDFTEAVTQKQLKGSLGEYYVNDGEGSCSGNRIYKNPRHGLEPVLK